MSQAIDIIVKGGIVMIPLLACSLISLESGWALQEQAKSLRRDDPDDRRCQHHG